MGRKLVRTVLLLAIGAVGATPVAAHNQEPAWLNPEALDDGLYIAVRHPAMLRSLHPFDIHLLITNVNGDSDVTVRAVRYLGATGVDAQTRRFDYRLDTKRQWFQEYHSVHERLEALTGPAASELGAPLRTRRAELLVQMSAGTLSDRYTVDPALSRSDSVRVAVEIDLDQDAGSRTIRKVVDIPIYASLPDGSGTKETLRYDAETGAMTRTADLAAPAGSGDLWYAGDQHLHTQYSVDAYFTNGNRSNVADYAAVAQSTGLDWIVVTDHGNIDFGLLGNNWYTPQQYAAGTNEAAQYRAQTGFLVFNGQELGAGAGDPSHVLAYPKSSDSTGFLPNPCSGGLFGHQNCEPEQTILDRVNGAGGIPFIAHPFQSSGGFFSPWDFNNGVTGWAGFEIFNAGDGVLTGADRQAILKWLQLLNDVAAPVGGELPLRDDFPTKFPVGLGNSDAHEPGLIGNTFTYCESPAASREAIMDSLAEGRCVASNGPLAFMEVDGFGPGQVAPLSTEGNTLSITIQSTPEFGAAGSFSVLLFVNGAQAAVLQPSGSPEFSTTTVFEDVVIGGSARYIVVIAVAPSGRLSIANPVWLEPSG